MDTGSSVQGVHEIRVSAPNSQDDYSFIIAVCSGETYCCCRGLYCCRRGSSSATISPSMIRTMKHTAAVRSKDLPPCVVTKTSAKQLAQVRHRCKSPDVCQKVVHCNQADTIPKCCRKISRLKSFKLQQQSFRLWNHPFNHQRTGLIVRTLQRDRT
jgi:hypothetical protein